MNLLLSYPRSGNTWYRYCIEFLTKKPTLGYQTNAAIKWDKKPIGNFVILGVDLNAKNILIKRHAIEMLHEDVDKLILLIRDYKECIVRHNELIGTPLTIDVLVNACSCKSTDRHPHQIAKGYIRAIEYYDSFTKNKMIVYYEDLITDLQSVMKKSLTFLNEKDAYLDSLIKNITFHENQCIDLYELSSTKGKNVKHHSKQMSSEERKEWDSFLLNNHEALFNKYLKRYEE